MQAPRYILVRAKLRGNYDLGQLRKMFMQRCRNFGGGGTTAYLRGTAREIEVAMTPDDFERVFQAKVEWKKFDIKDDPDIGTQYGWRWELLGTPVIPLDIARHIDLVIIRPNEKYGP